MALAQLVEGDKQIAPLEYQDIDNEWLMETGLRQGYITHKNLAEARARGRAKVTHKESPCGDGAIFLNGAVCDPPGSRSVDVMPSGPANPVAQATRACCVGVVLSPQRANHQAVSPVVRASFSSRAMRITAWGRAGRWRLLLLLGHLLGIDDRCPVDAQGFERRHQGPQLVLFIRRP